MTRRMLILLSILLLIPGLLHAQGGPVTRVFEIRYADPGRLQEVLSLFPARIQPVPELGLLTVNAMEEIMPAIEELIARLDVPVRSVQLTIHILGGDIESRPPKPMPAELGPVVEQLEQVFDYQSIRLLETIILRGMDGYRANASGGLQNDSYSGGVYSFSAGFRVRGGGGDAPPVLGLEGMQFDATVNTAGAATISTTLEVPAGQQVVVGRTALGSSAIILVMNAEFLD